MAEPTAPAAEAIDQDRPDPEDLGTAGDWLAAHATVLLIHYDPTTDVVRIDRGTTPLTIAKALLAKAYMEDADPETWGDPPAEEWEDED